MFTASILFQKIDLDVKKSFNTLKLIFLSEEVYLISCMIYYKNINVNTQNNSNSVREKRV